MRRIETLILEAWLMLLATLIPVAGPAQIDHNAIRTKGREVVNLCAEVNDKEILARSTPEVVKALAGRLKDVLNSVKSEAQIGPRISETVNGSQYVGVQVYGAKEITITVTFDGAGKMAGLFLSPRLSSKGVPPDPRAGYHLKARLRLPFDGQWWVFWGGDDLAHNYHAAYPDQRHAYDIVVQRNGSTHKGAGAQNVDYYAFGQPILAPTDGTVIEIDNSIPDNKPGVLNTTQIYGCHVVIDLGNSEFAVMCHFKQGTIRVKEGQRLRAGQIIGLCGNSGNSSESHLHIHLQDRARLGGGAISLPAPFTNFTVDGKIVKLGVPVRGQFISTAQNR